MTAPLDQRVSTKRRTCPKRYTTRVIWSQIDTDPSVKSYDCSWAARFEFRQRKILPIDNKQLLKGNLGVYWRQLVYIIASAILLSFEANARLDAFVSKNSPQQKFLIELDNLSADRPRSLLVSTDYGAQKIFDYNGDGYIDRLLISDHEIEVEYSSPNSVGFEQAKVTHLRGQNIFTILYELDPAANLYKMKSITTRKKQIHYSSRFGGKAVQSQPRSQHLILTSQPASVVEGKMENFVGDGGAKSKALCDFQLSEDRQLSTWQKIVASVEGRALAEESLVLGLVDTSCGDQETLVARGLSTMLLSMKEDSDTYYGCTDRLQGLKGISTKAQLDWLEMLHQKSSKVVVSCVESIPGGNAAQYSEDGKTIQLSQSWMRSAGTESTIAEKLYHESLHKAGVIDERLVVQIEMCCSKPYDPVGNRACKFLIDGDKAGLLHHSAVSEFVQRIAKVDSNEVARISRQIRQRGKEIGKEIECIKEPKSDSSCALKVASGIEQLNEFILQNYCIGRTTVADCEFLRKELVSEMDREIQRCLSSSDIENCWLSDKTYRFEPPSQVAKAEAKAQGAQEQMKSVLHPTSASTGVAVVPQETAFGARVSDAQSEKFLRSREHEIGQTISISRDSMEGLRRQLGNSILPRAEAQSERSRRTSDGGAFGKTYQVYHNDRSGKAVIDVNGKSVVLAKAFATINLPSPGIEMPSSGGGSYETPSSVSLSGSSPYSQDSSRASRAVALAEPRLGTEELGRSGGRGQGSSSARLASSGGSGSIQKGRSPDQASIQSSSGASSEAEDVLKPRRIETALEAQALLKKANDPILLLKQEWFIARLREIGLRVVVNRKAYGALGSATTVWTLPSSGGEGR